MKPSDHPPNYFDLLADAELVPHAFATDDNPIVRDLIAEHRPWRKARAIALQHGMKPLAVWLRVKYGRQLVQRRLVLLQQNGEPFNWVSIPQIDAALHKIDIAVGGGGPASLADGTGVLADAAVRDRITIRSLMDEAIESSVIEGAVTTRREARKLLRSNRAPASRHERMITNNYRGMRWITQNLGRDLSIEMLCELQRIMTEGTLEDPADAGRLRQADDPVVVEDVGTGDVVYEPPPATDLPARLGALCAYANQGSDGPEFVHPIIKACILHFMVAYEHPFVDGNGRTARAVFYWAALRAGYRVFEYTSVSAMIRASSGSYGRAYRDVETDGGDLTYFLRYKLRAITEAIRRVQEHLKREEARIQDSLRLTSQTPGLNLRQRMLLEHLFRHPGRTVTVQTMAATNGVVASTARLDLEDLLERRLLGFHKQGKQRHYSLSATAGGLLKPSVPEPNGGR